MGMARENVTSLYLPKLYGVLQKKKSKSSRWKSGCKQEMALQQRHTAMQTHGPSAKYALFCLTTKQVNQQRQRVLASLNGSAGWRKRPQYTRPCSRCAYSTSSNNSMINSLKVWHWCVGYCSGGEVSNNICLSPFMCFFCGSFITLAVADVLDPSPLSRSILFLFTSLDSLHHVWLRH